MAASSTAVDLNSISTDAQWQRWVQGVHNTLLAAGFVNTSDTGQINTSTTTRPTGASTNKGYEIWRFADTLQATAPIFFRVEYWSNAHAAGQGPKLKMTVGTGSDGAGTILGLNTGSMDPGNTAYTTGASNANTAIRACHTAGFGYIDSGVAAYGTMSTGAYIIARTCTTAGVPTAEGMGVYRQATFNSNAFTAGGFNFSTGQAYTVRVPVAGLSSTTSMPGGSTLLMAKHYLPLGYAVPTNGLLSYLHADVAASSTFTTPAWGSTSHTWLALGTTASNNMDTAATASVVAAVLWE